MEIFPVYIYCHVWGFFCMQTEICTIALRVIFPSEHKAPHDAVGAAADRQRELKG